MPPSARFRPPAPPPGVIPPERILSQFRSLLPGHWLVLAAPAGFGKTTLAATAAAADPAPTIWLQATRRHGIRGLLQRLAMGLDGLTEGAGSPIAFWASGQNAPEEVGAALSEADEQLCDAGASATVVVDDAHLLDSEEADAVLSDLHASTSGTLRWVLLSRTLPVFAQRNLASPRLATLRADDLRLSAPETLAALHTSVPALDEAALRPLLQPLAGWPAGIHVARLALATRPAEPDSIADLAGQCSAALEDYLRAAVLESVEARIREFLLRTAVATRLDDRLAAELAGRATRCDEVWRAGLFLERDRTREGEFRYQDLFRRTLLREAGATLEPGELRALAAKAAAWLRDHDSPDEAAQVLLDAGDQQAFDAFVAEQALPALRRGEGRQVVLWTDQVAPEKRGSGRLGVARAWGLLLELRAREAQLLAQRCAADACVASDPRLSAECEAILGSIDLATGNGARGLERLAAAERCLPEDADDLRAVTLGESGAAFANQGDLDAAEAALRRSLDAAERSRNDIVAVGARWHLANIRVMRGDLDGGLSAFRHGTAMSGSDSPNLCTVGAAEVLRERGETRAPRQLLERQLDAARAAGLAAVYLQACVGALRLDLDAGAVDDGIGWIEEARRVAVRTGLPGWTTLLSAYEALLRLRGGAGTNPPFVATGESSVPLGLVTNQPPEFVALVNARIAMAAGRFEGIEASLAAMRQAATTQARGRSVLEIDLLLARLAAKTGASDAAERQARAVEAARARGFVRLAEEFATASDGTRPVDGPARPHRPACPLSERELDVLRLVAEGYTNAAAARRLFVSPATIKKHLENVYARIGAGNRTHAVAMARENGWIDRE